MMRTALALALVLLATPALAERIVPMCPQYEPGLHFEFGFSIGEKMTETERAAFYEQRLRARGINASQTVFWNGCLQAIVRENGHNTMQYFDPDTLERIELER
jgi:hypothetical protein